MQTRVPLKASALANVQRIRKIALAVGAVISIVLLLLSDSRWASGTLAHETIEWIGIVLMVVAILGRTWCTLYIGGRKIYALVDVGPYSVTRNPLYVLSVIGALGAGAQTGSVTMALLLGLAAYFIFHIVIRREEDALRETLGVTYLDYCSRVPRFFPNFTRWRDVETLEVVPNRIRTTFFDGSLLLLSIPLAEGVEYLHDIGILPTLFSLP